MTGCNFTGLEWYANVLCSGNCRNFRYLWVRYRKKYAISSIASHTLLAWKWAMNSHGIFSDRWSPFLSPSLCQYTKLQNMSKEKYCVLQVDGIIYWTTIVFWGEESCEPHSLYRQWQKLRELFEKLVILTLQPCACLDKIIFMKDGTSLHIAMPVIQLLKRYFGNDRIISCHFPTTGFQGHPPSIFVTSGNEGYFKMLCSVDRLQI